MSKPKNSGQFFKHVAQILLRNFNKTPLKYTMENIAGDVSMSVQSQSTAMQTADVSTSCLPASPYIKSFVDRPILCCQKIRKPCQISYKVVRELYNPVHCVGQIENRFGLFIFIFVETFTHDVISSTASLSRAVH
jgi:hypothetical protein